MANNKQIIIQRNELIREQFNQNYQLAKNLVKQKNPNLKNNEIWYQASRIFAKAFCIIHKKELKNEQPCIDCRWEEFEIKFEPQQAGIRYEQRQAPLWMYKRLHYGKCWCNKPKDQWKSSQQRRFCCGKHREIWNFRIECYWNSYRHIILLRDRGICQECGFEVMEFENGKIKNGFSKCDWEVDHILAISHGGMCYDSKNVRLLCRKCHNKKTGEDLRKLKLKRNKQETLSPYISGEM